MTAHAYNKIVLKGSPREEGTVAIGSTILPGMLVEAAAGGHQKHSADGGHVGPVAFARENHENNGAGVETVILQNDSMTIVYPQAGDVIYASVEADVNAREMLTSKGNGKLKQRVAESGAPIVAQALEDATNGRARVVIVGGGPAVDISV